MTPGTAPCPTCGSTQIRMTLTDLTPTGAMAYRLRCYDCGHSPQWAPTWAAATQRWRRLKRRTPKEAV